MLRLSTIGLSWPLLGVLVGCAGEVTPTKATDKPLANGAAASTATAEGGDGELGLGGAGASGADDDGANAGSEALAGGGQQSAQQADTADDDAADDDILGGDNPAADDMADDDVLGGDNPADDNAADDDILDGDNPAADDTADDDQDFGDDDFSFGDDDELSDDDASDGDLGVGDDDELSDDDASDGDLGVGDDDALTGDDDELSDDDASDDDLGFGDDDELSNDDVSDDDMAFEDDDASNGDDPESGQLKGITAAHNAHRAAMDPDDPIPPLEWDEEIAAVAQAYAEVLAEDCEGLVHSMGTGYGENLAMYSSTDDSGSYGSGVESADSWYSEIECYSYGNFMTSDECSSECDQYGGCGHYTQVIWRETERVGCGVASCFDGRWYTDFYVCNYDPPGNYIGEIPY